jgi:hypothetical protein
MRAAKDFAPYNPPVNAVIVAARMLPAGGSMLCSASKQLSVAHVHDTRRHGFKKRIRRPTVLAVRTAYYEQGRMNHLAAVLVPNQ